MARPRYPKHDAPRPPALPPAAQTVGQLVAETLRLYGNRFLLALPLGLPVAIADQVALDQDRVGRIVVLAAAAPFFSAAYAAAAMIAFRMRPGAARIALAVAVGTLVFLPAAVCFPWFALASIAWLAVTGHAVPAIVVEGTGAGASLRRSVQIARADLVHAIGGLATLVLLFGLTRIALSGLLRSQAENTVRVSIFLADVVLAPIVFLGGALLYANLAARVGLDRDARRTLRDDAVRRQ